MEFIAADSRLAVFAALERFGGDALIMAGGTHLMMQIAKGGVAPHAVINIERVGDLRAITAGDRLRIGAMVTLAALARAPALADLAGLRKAASLCGGWQTQSVGTIGGNICHAAPTADLVPPLLVHEASVVLETAGGATRTVPLERFLLGGRRTARTESELLVAVDLAPMPARTADVFEKVGRRSAMEVAIASIAIRLTLADDRRTIDQVRIAIGALADRPYRARDSERILQGRPLSDSVVAAAAAVLLQGHAPLDDTRASAAYRQTLLPRIFGRALRAGATAAAAGPAES